MADEVCDNGGSGGSGGTTPNVVIAGQQPPPAVVELADDKSKSPRHPRWTRQETLTLIEGKKVAENRGRRGRRSSSVLGSDQVEPKWDSVASYCKQHAVNRGPVQCRKRWSNMVGDFKKIKAWESQVKHESESYWLMRNDMRKENKLPGFFDQEVFDVLDGKAFTKAAYKLALVTVSADTKDDGLFLDSDKVEAEEEEGEAEGEEDVVFDSGRRASSDDGLFLDSDQVEEEMDDKGFKNETARVYDHDNPTTKIPDPVPISEKRCQTFHEECSKATLKDQQPNSERCKRRRVMTEESPQDGNIDARLIDVLEKNANVLNARLEAENANCQLDRDQRKDYNSNLLSALGRISDALTKIADKL